MSENMTNYPPPGGPKDDTHPTGTFPQVYPGANQRTNSRPRWLLLVIVLVSFGLVTSVLALVLTSGGGDTPEDTVQDAAVIGEGVDAPADTAPDAEPMDQIAEQPDAVAPTQAEAPTQAPAVEVVNVAGLRALDPAAAEALLQKPAESLVNETDADIELNLFDPFTIIPDRPRFEVIQYTAAQGDTIRGIAERFGLEPETIAWSNPRRIIQVLRPGDVVNIPPTDGVYVTTVGSTRTIADWVEQYAVDDPFVVLDSPYNPQLAGFSPDTVPPDGTPIFIPGGEAEEVVWVANISVTGGDSGEGASAQSGPPRVQFQAGEQGSCAPQEAVGGTFWTNPMTPGTYRITQGYYSYHTGIDLAAPVGTPVYAANGGRVVFAGWNSFGYGYTIAIVHGPFMTVYAHLSAYYVNCGQDIAAGTAIGEVGNTGNSSGPHLHFEIRQRQGNTYVPQDPSYTLGF
ncbi:MAG: peptidoglycan DD-metalloendopeptidase family protein [Chloroflexota bacterium]